MPVQFDPTSSITNHASCARPLPPISSSPTCGFTSSTLASTAEPSMLSKAWSWITTKIYSFFDWIFSFLPCFGSSKIEYLEDLLEDPKSSAQAFVKAPLENVGQLFEAVVENPREARTLLKENKKAKDTFISDFKAALQGNEAARKALKALPFAELMQKLLPIFQTQHQIVQRAISQTCKDIAEAIISEEKANESTIKDLKQIFGTILPNYFSALTKEEFAAFFSGFDSGITNEGLVDYIISHAPASVKAEMPLLEKNKTAIVNVFDLPYGIHIAVLDFKWHDRLVQNLVFQFTPDFYVDTIQILGKDYPMITTLLGRMQVLAETTKGRELLKRNLHPDTTQILAPLYAETVAKLHQE